MNRKAKHIAAAAATVLVAAIVNVATGMATEDSGAWWALGVLFLLGIALQYWAMVSGRAENQEHSHNAEPRRRRQRVHDVDFDGDIKQVMTKPGDQTVSGSKIKGSLIQRQGD